MDRNQDWRWRCWCWRILDYAFQRWKHEQDLKMTPQEVREEMKNLEGDPQVAARRRAVQRQLAMNRLSDAVPKADVVITNPTDTGRGHPVRARDDGRADRGGQGRRPGRRADPPPGPGARHPDRREEAAGPGPLSRRRDQPPHPPDNYAAVAEVLAYVYQLKGKDLPAPPAEAA